MTTMPDYSSYQALSRRIVQNGVLPGPRPRVPPVNVPATSPTTSYLGTPDLFLAAISFVAVGGDATSVDLRVRRAAEDHTSGPANPLKAATFSGMDGSFTTSEQPAYDVLSTDYAFKKLSQSVFCDPLLARSVGSEEALRGEIELARASLLWGLGGALVNGNGIGYQLNGLLGVTTTSPWQDFTITSSASTTNFWELLDEFYHLLSRATTSDSPVASGPDAFVTSDRVTRRLVHSQHRLGVTPEFRDCPLVGGRTCYHLFGIPVLTAPVDEGGDVANVYAVKLRGPAGLKVAHLGGRSEDRGVTVEKLSQDVATGGVGAIVQGYYALVVPEFRSVVCLSGVALPAFTAP